MNTRRITNKPQTGVISGGYVKPSATNINIAWATVQPFAISTSTATPVSLGAAFKPKRAGKNPNLSHIVFVLDESSSMSVCHEQTIAGYNEYLKAQKLDAVKTGIKTLVSLFKFDGRSVIKVFDRQDVSQVPLLDKSNYKPNGSTNLLDAVGGVMLEINKLLAEKKKADRESVIITILTDGEENQSRTFKNSDIEVMVEKAEGKSWGFMFLGANVDAFKAGAAMGFTSENTLQFDTKYVGQTMRSAADMTSRMKSAYASGLDTQAVYSSTKFYDDERAGAVGGDSDDGK